MQEITAILLILFLPLASFLYQIFFAKKDCHKVPLISILVSLTLSISLFFQTFGNGDYLAQVSWIDIYDFQVPLGVWINDAAIIMIFVVSLVSFLVHLYSTSYMKGDLRYSRYFAYLGLFTFSMYGIVIADNLFMIFIFWELVGLSSYLLIGFWFEKMSAAYASKKAFLLNRIGDIGMFLGMMTLFLYAGNTFNLIELHNNAINMNYNLLTVAGILLFFGAIGKSAQVPLQVWLPDAMEGPTPVSALIHAATMVAAGVYMLVRIFPIMTTEALTFIAIIGSVTALVAGLIALTQNDIKKVLAYSTVSQLGYMVLAVGVGNYVAAMYHLITHAMFKACLFLGSGSVIHGMHHAIEHSKEQDMDPQDMRNMGGLKSKMPITYITMLISTLSICGVPFFSGFLSKDEIINSALSFYSLKGGMSIIFPIIAFIAALITALYMFRMIFMTFWLKPANKEVHSHLHESDSFMRIPLIILSVLSFSFIFNLNPFNPEGWVFHSISVYENESYHQESIHLYHDLHYEMKKNHTMVSIVSVILGFSGILMAYYLYIRNQGLLNRIYNRMHKMKLYHLSLNKFYFDRDYIHYFYNPFKKMTNRFSYFDWEIYDKKIINFFGRFTLKISKISGKADYTILDQYIVDGFARLTNYSGQKLKKLQSGVIQNYLLAAIIGIIILIMIIQQF
tara:strand:- start:990 stop:3020 length:2031 start_codon:yes stop_codon:yes gene_type:complete